MAVRGTAVSQTWVPGGSQGGYTGWGTGRAIPGTTQPPLALSPEEHPPAERAPGSPAGAGVGWVGAGVGRPFAYWSWWCAGLLYPPSGPGRPLAGPPWYRTPPRAKGRDSDLIPVKLVKTTKCHQNMSKRPIMLPIFQNGSQKSPLEIPGFPFWLAFSPKELMVLFGRGVDFIVKMTKCRQLVHTQMSREVVVRYPHCTTQQAAPVVQLLI